MTTNSYGSALPAFDFPQTVAKVTKRRLPLGARILPIAAVAATGLAYYATTTTTTTIKTQQPSLQQTVESSSAHQKRQLEMAYGDRSSLADIEAAARAYEKAYESHDNGHDTSSSSSSSYAKPGTSPRREIHFRESLEDMAREIGRTL
ncbi:hypothetical protein F4778DRAFT_103416 [Xylariomycetidae sp. FL2044]|nr:hypothetical protein F4778DRAFT_103416 [Xylariomycetidae sp. FL2044]